MIVQRKLCVVSNVVLQQLPSGITPPEGLKVVSIVMLWRDDEAPSKGNKENLKEWLLRLFKLNVPWQNQPQVGFAVYERNKTTKKELNIMDRLEEMIHYTVNIHNDVINLVRIEKEN